MRIIALISLLFLSACSTGQKIEPAARVGTVSEARDFCNSKYGGSAYDFESCYRNRPEVQASARDGRMKSLNIISQNRSPYNSRGRSYPVE